MPAVTLAIRTLKAIDELVQADQGAAYRGWLKQVLPHIGDAYRTDEEAFRSHLGASVLGADCGRAIWYGFHWASERTNEGRMVRLLNRGHIEEARFIALMLMLGVQVYQQDAEGKQYKISFADGHGGGSGDGVGIGIPDLAAGMACLLEFKTHNEKSFIELAGDLKTWRACINGGQFKGKGVREAKFEHYVQMQIYMRKMGLAVCIYFAVCKNTDDLYAEVVPLDPTFADQFISRGTTIIDMPLPPTKLNKSPGFYKCVYCEHKPVCHLGAAPAVNCRTCAWVEKGPAGTWKCNKHKHELSKQGQIVGCPDYEVANCFK
jgi:hypothetical protein